MVALPCVTDQAISFVPEANPQRGRLRSDVGRRETSRRESTGAGKCMRGPLFRQPVSEMASAVTPCHASA